MQDYGQFGLPRVSPHPSPMNPPENLRFVTFRQVATSHMNEGDVLLGIERVNHESAAYVLKETLGFENTHFNRTKTLQQRAQIRLTIGSQGSHA